MGWKIITWYKTIAWPTALQIRTVCWRFWRCESHFLCMHTTCFIKKFKENVRSPSKEYHKIIKTLFILFIYSTMQASYSFYYLIIKALKFHSHHFLVTFKQNMITKITIQSHKEAYFVLSADQGQDGGQFYKKSALNLKCGQI